MLIRQSSMELNKALFLDRDGVLIDYVPYLNKTGQVRIPSGAGKALKKWQDAGYLLIIFTNQSGIGRGYFTMNDVEAVHDHIRQEYEQFGVLFHDILICPHHPEADCKCRKPSPYLLVQTAKKYRVSLSQSFFIGDGPSDIECAIEAGCNPILVLTGRGKETAQTLDKYSVKIPVIQRLADTVQFIDSHSSHLNQ